MTEVEQLDNPSFGKIIHKKSKDINGSINPSKLSSELKKELDNRVHNQLPGVCTRKLSEKIYILINDIVEIPICNVCNEGELKFDSGKFKYRTTCSHACANIKLKVTGKAKTRAKNRNLPDLTHIKDISAVMSVIFGKNNIINSNYMVDPKATLSDEVINQIYQKTDFCTSETISDRLHIISKNLTASDMQCPECSNHSIYGNTFCSTACSNKNNLKKQKTKNTCLDRYGVVTSLSLEENKEKRKKVGPINTRDHWPLHFLDVDKLKTISHDKTKKQISDAVKVPYQSVCTRIRDYNIPHITLQHRSSYEDYLIKYISSEFDVVIDKNRKDIISPYELDLFFPSLNVAIEFDGDYWHSAANKDEEYNRQRIIKNKISLLNTNKIPTLFINEHMWNDSTKNNIYKSMISNLIGRSDRIWGRQCTIERITNKSKKEVREFIANHHIQGTCGFSVGYLLRYNDEIVSVMTLGKPRFSKVYDWEIIRFCSKHKVSIVGGASKLFTRFIKDFNPDNVVTFADRRWTQPWDNVYLHLGFIEDTSYKGLNYGWYKSNVVLTRYRTTKQKLSKLLPNFDNTLTEHQNMYNNGFRKLFDQGQLKYIYNKG